MITSIVFSKDRALQLDLTLKTIKQNLEIISDVVVVYKTSERQHEDSYEILQKEHSDVSFLKQSPSLFFDIMLTINGVKSDYICFFTDDNIVYRGVSIDEDQIDGLFSSVEHSGGCACLSLRVGSNTTLRAIQGKLVNDAIPILYSIPPFILWGFTSVPPGGYWSYPLSVDGHIFKRERILEFCIELDLLDRYHDQRGVPRAKWSWQQTPNEFESKIQRFYFELPPLMACLEESCVVNSPNNKVQDSHNNISGLSHNYSAEYLLGKYMRGSRINLDHLDFSNIQCPHTEIDLMRGIV